MLAQQQFGFEVIDLQPHAAQIAFRKKIGVVIGGPVAWTLQNSLHATRRIRIFLDFLRPLPRQRFAPFKRMGGRWNLILHRFSNRGLRATLLKAS